MIYLYLAGPLFSEADRQQRKEEAKLLRKILDKSKKPYFLANPLELPLDDDKPVTAAKIFTIDYLHINAANVFFLELATGDTGTMVELGNIIEKYMQGKPIKIYPVFSDLRLSRNDLAGLECPVGFNSYLVGCLKANDIDIYYSFAEALSQFSIDLNGGYLENEN